jgi:hypothetical protein
VGVTGLEPGTSTVSWPDSNARSCSTPSDEIANTDTFHSLNSPTSYRSMRFWCCDELGADPAARDPWKHAHSSVRDDRNDSVPSNRR